MSGGCRGPGTPEATPLGVSLWPSAAVPHLAACRVCSSDSLGWKLFYVTGCLFVAVQNLEDWEVRPAEARARGCGGGSQQGEGLWGLTRPILKLDLTGFCTKESSFLLEALHDGFH